MSLAPSYDTIVARAVTHQEDILHFHAFTCSNKEGGAIGRRCDLTLSDYLYIEPQPRRNTFAVVDTIVEASP